MMNLNFETQKVSQIKLNQQGRILFYSFCKIFIFGYYNSIGTGFFDKLTAPFCSQRRDSLRNFLSSSFENHIKQSKQTKSKSGKVFFPVLFGLISKYKRSSIFQGLGVFKEVMMEEQRKSGTSSKKVHETNRHFLFSNKVHFTKKIFRFGKYGRCQ